MLAPFGLIRFSSRPGRARLAAGILVWATGLSILPASPASSARIRVQGFLAEPVLRLTPLNNGLGEILGLRVALVTRTGIVAGAGGYDVLNGLATEHAGARSDLGMWYAGLHAGYLYEPYPELGLLPAVLIGAGALTPFRGGTGAGPDRFAVFEPEANAVYRLNRSFGLGAAIGCRMVAGAQLVPNSALGGFSVSLVLRYRSF